MMSEVKRYCPSMDSQELYDLQSLVVDSRDYDAALAREAALREELATAKAVMAHDYELMQQRLTAAEQRNAELIGLLQGWLDLFPYRGTFQDGPLAKMKGHTRAALKPTESGASE
jgi:hypothetical protein